PLRAPRSMLCSVSRGCSSFLTASRRSGRCTGCWCRKDGLGSVCGAPFNTTRTWRPRGDAAERHVSREVAAGLRTVCALGDADAVRSLLLQAGFREVRIAIAILVMRFASVEAFVPGQFAATPFAGAVAALDANARAALLEDVRVALR